jgi:uncharacterized repeat protein (TIGR02543 family)
MRSLGVSCPQQGSYTVDGKYSPSDVYVLSSGIPAAIEAVPGSCYEFFQWDLVSGSATIDDYKSAETSITLTSGNASIKASFARIRYNLAISSGTGGTTSPITGTTVECGVAKDILAIPGDCMVFDKWEKVSGNLTIDNAASASTKVTLIEGNGEVKAVFKSKTYTVTMAVSSSAGGTAAVTNTAHPGASYYCGDVIRITAAPNAGYDFTGWSGDISGSTNPCDFSIIKAMSITANFSLKKFTLTITNNGYCTTTPSGDRIVDYNQALGISASPTNQAYTVFEGWSVVSGTGVAFADSSSPSTSVRLTAGNATIKASYGQGSVTWYESTGGPTSQIEHVVYPNLGGTFTITTAQTNYCGSTCNPPLSFVTWQVSGTGSVSFANQKSATTTVTRTGLGRIVITPCYYPTCR